MPLVQTGRSGSDSPLLYPDERILHTFNDITLYLGTKTIGVGHMYVTSLNVVWLHSTDTQCNYSIDYQSIIIHAISKDLTTFPQVHVYCQLDNGDEDDDSEDEDQREVEETLQLSSVFEARFAPQRDEDVDAIYAAMSEGAELNPAEELEGEGDFFDAESLQCAPGFDLASLGFGNASLAQLAQSGGYDEHDDEDEEFEEEDEGEDVTDDVVNESTTRPTEEDTIDAQSNKRTKLHHNQSNDGSLQ